MLRAGTRTVQTERSKQKSPMERKILVCSSRSTLVRYREPGASDMQGCWEVGETR